MDFKQILLAIIIFWLLCHWAILMLISLSLRNLYFWVFIIFVWLPVINCVTSVCGRIPRKQNIPVINDPDIRSIVFTPAPLSQNLRGFYKISELLVVVSWYPIFHLNSSADFLKFSMWTTIDVFFFWGGIFRCCPFSNLFSI